MAGGEWRPQGEKFTGCLFLMKTQNYTRKEVKKLLWGTSLVVQWLRIHLPMQGTWVRALGSGKIPHVVEQLSPCATTTEPAL